MAKLSSIAKNNKKARTVAKYADKRKALKAAGDSLGLQLLPRNASPTRVRNRCSLTGRSRGFIGKYGISRIKFRDLALEGKIPGVRKASW
jgi:small subunit ribosomal protein S14